MKTESLFRETPFGGYKREQVLEYIEATDVAHGNEVRELNDRIADLSEALDAANKKNEPLENELKIKTELAVEAEQLRRDVAEKDRQIEELLAKCEELSAQTAEVVARCEEISAEMEKQKEGFRCEHLNGEVCVAVSEKAAAILADAEEKAKQRIAGAEEQASGIILKARVEAQSMISEAEGQTDAMARQVSEEAHNIIEMTVAEAKEIIQIAKNKGDSILTSSAQSIGKIKGNLSSMQMVVKNIENELKSARDSLSTERLFPKED